MTPGATIRRIRGDDYVVVTISLMFPGAPPTIYGLARALHLQTDITFNALLGYRANAPAVVGLFRDQIGGTPPALEEARRRLRVAGARFTANHQFPGGTDTPYVAWGVAPDRDEPVVLPLSADFRRVMDEATRQRQRQTRLQAIRPDLDALRVELDAIRVKARELGGEIQVCHLLGESHAREVALLEALDGLLGAMLAHPRGAVDPGDRNDVVRLRALLDTLRAEARRHMLLEPADAFRAGLVAGRNRAASELIALVEAPAFIAHVRTLVDNRDIADPALYQTLIDVVGSAFQTLLGSPQSERVIDAHVRPMIDALASRPIDLTGVAAPLNAGLDRAIREIPVAPAPNSVLVVIVGVAGALPQTVGNYPGPNTLAVGILQWAAPHLLARFGSRAAEATTMAGRLTRSLIACASVRAQAGGGGAAQPMTAAERAALVAAIDQGNLTRVRAVNWSGRFQNGPAWGGAVALASAVCLMAAVQSDDASTLRRWSNIIGSGSGTALGVSVALGRYVNLVQTGIVAGAAGRALGVIGGAAAVVSGVVSAEEEYRSHDTVGMWVAIGGATGGVLSVAGFLIGVGAATTATVAGAPVGVVLMVAGAVLGIGSAAVSVIRALVTAGSQVVFEALIEAFARPGGPGDVAAGARPSLRAALTAVRTAHHPVDFWDVNPDRSPELFDLGFAAAHIARIVNETEPNVTNRLRVAGRIQ